MQLQGHKLHPFKSLYLATLGGARALRLDHRIGSFAAGNEADFVVLDYKATPLIEQRIKGARNLEEKLFVLMMLGDDRCVKETFSAGKSVHKRSNGLHSQFIHLSIDLHHAYDARHGDQYPPSIRGETVRISTEDNSLGPHFNMVKICCEANPEFCLAARGDVAELAQENPRDPRQIWIKDDKWGIENQDKSGCPAFALVNKATKRALKHGDRRMDQIYLEHYNPYEAEMSALWTLCPTNTPSDQNRYRAMRTVENIELNMDAKNGEIREGTKLILFEWNEKSNQKWKLHLVH